jgi:uncharacterized membrane protein YjjP (DUF1212 family)
MILHNKLFRIDMVLVVAVLSLLFVKPGRWNDVLTAFIAAVFVISFANHLRQYILYKKFY